MTPQSKVFVCSISIFSILKLLECLTALNGLECNLNIVLQLQSVIEHLKDYFSLGRRANFCIGYKVFQVGIQGFAKFFAYIWWYEMNWNRHDQAWKKVIMNNRGDDGFCGQTATALNHLHLSRGLGSVDLRFLSKVLKRFLKAMTDFVRRVWRYGSSWARKMSSFTHQFRFRTMQCSNWSKQQSSQRSTIKTG